MPPDGRVRVMLAGRERDVPMAGERLSDYFAVFVRAGVTPGMKVASHVENLAQSMCGRSSGERMWCGACHDPHALPRPEDRVAWFRGKCLGCHRSGDCLEAEADRRRNGDDCTACHMPKNPVTDAEHVVYTDHSIPRRPRTAGEAPAAQAALVPFGGGPAGERDLGLAYAIAAERNGSEFDQSRAFELLRRVAGKSPADSQALLYLAEAYRRNHDERSAIPLYERAMRLDPAQVAASAALGAIRMERGQYEDAIRLWRDALSKNPGLVLVRFNLAGALMRTGDLASAQSVLEKALEFNPSFAAAARLLNEVRRRIAAPRGDAGR